MSAASPYPPSARWGNPPWTVDFRPPQTALPAEVDFAVVGGGFTGLSAAAWLRILDPSKSVAVLEATTIGAGASGRTGGMTLAETSEGELPGLGDVLAGFSEITARLNIDCELHLPGAFEIGRKKVLTSSPISWSDSGTLGVVAEVPGGTSDPGKLVAGLARAAHAAGAQLCENAPVDSIVNTAKPTGPLQLTAGGRPLIARKALIATNALSLELSDLAGRAQPMFTLAVATAPLTPQQIEAIGLASGKPFYTVDFPYLWGRLLPGNAVLFGGGLVRPSDWRDIAQLDINSGECAELIARIQRRVRALHPALRAAEFTHGWGGPILAAHNWTPVFGRHPHHPHVVVAGAYAGHGVALSVYLGRWAAEAMLGQRELPEWDRADRDTA